MLAYVFWHWPRPEIDTKAYAAELMEFHRVLVQVKPEGFHHSAVFHIHGAPWAAAKAEAYEDWHLLAGSCALDVLNAAAVSPPCKEPHHQVAQHTASGAGGLYRLHSGQAHMAESQFAHWFAKPAGMTYDVFYQLMEPWTNQPRINLWRRQMVLGPAPEFCLRSPARLALAKPFDGVTVSSELIYSGERL